MHSGRCGTQQLACLRLVHWLRVRHWSPTTPRQPTAELFKQAESALFGSEAAP
jgi:hypothetical protein